MREVLPGLRSFGPVFWSSPTIPGISAKFPGGFEEATKREGIKTSSEMSQQVQSDIALLKNWKQLPCLQKGTLKCEACRNGCDSNQNSSLGSTIGGGAEYTHYTVANTTEEVILHRTKDHKMGFVHRADTSSKWSSQAPSTIPDADSNLNAGPLPDGRVYLLSNACTKGRDPLVLSFTSDGWSWDEAYNVMSCEALGRCGPRYKGKSKHKGVAYPQGLTVTTPGSAMGFYAVATNSKEDVWVAKIPLDKMPRQDTQIIV
jgi:hypothetical protein